MSTHDKFQARYIAHQKRKQQTILTGSEDKPFDIYSQEDKIGAVKILAGRKSRRIYSKEKISKEELKYIKQFASYAPSSCDRKAVEIVISKKRVDSLVGGRGWANKADKILLLYASELAYKSPAEKDFMPYLDAGFMAQNIYLICEVLNIRCCFINPNRTGKELDKKGYRFCGAMALGK